MNGPTIHQKVIIVLASQRKVRRPCVKSLQLDLRSKSILIKSYCSSLGSKKINSGKYKPYCLIHFTLI